MAFMSTAPRCSVSAPVGARRIRSVFEERRPATPEELARLYDSWGIPSMNDQLAAAQISEIPTVVELGAQHTVISVPNPKPGGDRVYTVAELHASWSVGGGNPERDQGPYQHFVGVATADPAFAPELLFEPASTSSGWWLLDGSHRAVALYSARKASRVTELHLRVYVLPRQLR
jgi:hypothetical protein